MIDLLEKDWDTREETLEADAGEKNLLVTMDRGRLGAIDHRAVFLELKAAKTLVIAQEAIQSLLVHFALLRSINFSRK